MPAMRLCLDCGQPSADSRCPGCFRTRETELYGAAHQRQRAALDTYVRSGQATCGRCYLPIPPNTDWDLDHDTNGPTHPYCNRATI